MSEKCMSYREIRIQTIKLIIAIIIFISSGIVAYNLGRNFEGVIVISFDNGVQFPSFSTVGYNSTDGSAYNLTINGTELSDNFSITDISTGIIDPNYFFSDIELRDAFLYRNSDNPTINYLFRYGNYNIRTFAVNITSNNDLNDISIKFKSRLNCYVGFIDIKTEGNKDGIEFIQHFYFFANSTDAIKITAMEHDFIITSINFTEEMPYNRYWFSIDTFLNPLSTSIIDPTFR